MSYHEISVSFQDPNTALRIVSEILKRYQHEDHYAYQREDHWYLGLGNYASLIVDSKGDTCSLNTQSSKTSFPIDSFSISTTVREFLIGHAGDGDKVFGQVGFNYAAYIRGQSFNPGKWPLLSLLSPRTDVTLGRNSITLRGVDEKEVKELREFVENVGDLQVGTSPEIIGVNASNDASEYVNLVENALADIAQGEYTKIILSRAVEIEHKINMPATLLLGRQGNNPARSFSLNQGGYQATGFSPELVMSTKNRKLVTEPLAGTRSCKGTAMAVEALRKELKEDPKEILEHELSVQATVEELSQLCQPGTVAIEDFMSVRKCGPVQHLGSRVTGILADDKDMWNAFDVLFPSITASGIPKQAAINAIQRLEAGPRELYSGAVIMIDGPDSFEAALVLRTVFQQPGRQWIQAGAGIISQSSPEREFTETCEKLASIGPFVVPIATDEDS
ncbi:hypothetical protein N7541_007726 [Penicillium brevicompactum]|uniref:Chorismate-utilising enzyme C-terminal domain-containing protein n=1 Tax=Penicillium brevicompactum TaxID=5074 RepID=A0A9W9R0Q5_PENBR|nr:hypothetical protein N7541_007726 [Penicillium brevicompactum]